MWRSSSLLVAFGLVVGASQTVAAEPEKKTDATRIARLISQLGSSEFAEREAAARALDEAGVAALEALQQISEYESVAVRRRAEDIARKIEKRQETEKILAPGKVHLKYKDMPVSEAVADLAKKTGMTISLEGDQTKISQRKVTLDTGETTFWQAFEKFCGSAGLIESSLIPNCDSPLGTDQMRKRMLDAQLMQLGRPAYTRGSISASKVTLYDGKAPQTPTCQVGALRVRLLPPNTAILGQAKRSGETLLGLEIACEPSMSVLTVVNVGIDRAVDNRGVAMKPADNSLSGGNEAMNGYMYYLNQADQFGSTHANSHRQVPLRLQVSNKATKGVAELKGAVGVKVHSSPMPLVVIDDIHKTVGKTIKGTDGVALKVVEITKKDNGLFKLHFEMDLPANLGAFMGGLNAGLSGNPMPQGFSLTVHDAKGMQVPEVTMETKVVQFNNLTCTQELIYAFQPKEKQGPPTKLILTGRRQVVVDVPFVLKNMLLP